MVERARDLQLQTLTVEQDGRVLTTRVVAPPYNLMTAQVHRDFDVPTRAVDDDESVGAVVVTGGVEKRYITHFDIADILAADDDAVGFILPELLIGLTTTVGGQRLAQLIGPDRALEMLLEGRMYTRQEALEMGLIRSLVPAR